MTYKIYIIYSWHHPFLGEIINLVRINILKLRYEKVINHGSVKLPIGCNIMVGSLFKEIEYLLMILKPIK